MNPVGELPNSKVRLSTVYGRGHYERSVPKPPIKEIVAIMVIMDMAIMNVQFPNCKNVKRDHMNPVGE